MRLTDTLDAYFLAKDFTPKARTWYRSKLSAFVAWCAEQGVEDAEGMTAPLVRRFIAEARVVISPRYNRPMSSNTLHGYARAIKCYLNWCIGDDLVSEKVTRRLEMPKREVKVIQTFTDEHVARLFVAAGVVHPQYPWFVARDRAILAVLLDTGIRANELCDLTLDRVHINPDDAYLLVNGKGRKQREVGLGDKSRQLLHRYIHRFRPIVAGETHVFLTRADKQLHPEGIDRLLYKLRDLSGVQGIRVSAHTFRHTYAVNYLKAGGDIYKLSRLMGHTSVVITEGYLRAFQARDARNGLSVFDEAMKKRA